MSQIENVQRKSQLRILITGATGLVGRNLMRHLLLLGHDVSALVRSPKSVIELPAQKVFSWTKSGQVPHEALLNQDVVIHLAGEGIAERRWTSARKQSLMDSRCAVSRSLVKTLAEIKPDARPKVLIAASAIGYYGDSGDAPVDESSPPGHDFLADICQKWEAENLRAEDSNLRVVIMRFGVILAKEGGALKKMGPAVIGSGRQWLSWIHIDDVLRFTALAAEDQNLKGVYNLTSPQAVTNREFTKAFAKALKYPFVISVPAVVLRLALGEMSSMLTAGQNVAPKRLLAAGFKFQYPDLSQALSEIYGTDSFLDSHLIVNQFVALPRTEVFPFFSKAENLETLTPPWLKFQVTKTSTTAVEKNTLIDYRLNIHGVPVGWRTLISEWNPDSSFVDEQLRGPYKKWHHLHLFESVPGGTLLRDEVTFRVPGWILGRLFLNTWIQHDVNRIFSFRQSKIRDLEKSGTLK